jgi:hypothetical protein
MRAACHNLAGKSSSRWCRNRRLEGSRVRALGCDSHAPLPVVRQTRNVSPRIFPSSEFFSSTTKPCSCSLRSRQSTGFSRMSYLNCSYMPDLQSQQSSLDHCRTYDLEWNQILKLEAPPGEDSASNHNAPKRLSIQNSNSLRLAWSASCVISFQTLCCAFPVLRRALLLSSSRRLIYIRFPFLHNYHYVLFLRSTRDQLHCEHIELVSFFTIVHSRHHDLRALSGIYSIHTRSSAVERHRRHQQQYRQWRTRSSWCSSLSMSSSSSAVPCTCSSHCTRR